MATWTLELTTQVKYVSPPGAKFITAHLCKHATPVMPLALSAYLTRHTCHAPCLVSIFYCGQLVRFRRLHPTVMRLATFRLERISTLGS